MEVVMVDRVSEEGLEAALKEAHKQIEVGGFYAHYKNLDRPYKVLGLGILEASQEPCVIYQAFYGSEFMRTTVWVRSVAIWLSEVPHNGKMVPRFQKLSSENLGG